VCNPVAVKAAEELHARSKGSTGYSTWYSTLVHCLWARAPAHDGEYHTIEGELPEVVREGHEGA
jgi:hypothetical protein